MKKNPRRAACVEMLRAVERNCSPRYNYQLAVKRFMVYVEDLRRTVVWLSVMVLDFWDLLPDSKDHRGSFRF